MKLMKYQKRQKIALSFASLDFFLKKFCYEVIVKQFFYKRSANHYSPHRGLRLEFRTNHATCLIRANSASFLWN